MKTAASMVFYFFSFTCVLFSQEINRWFPSEVFFHSKVLTEYISGIRSFDEQDIRKEYLIILAFVSKTINSHQANIKGLLTGASFAKWPALVDGELTFVEIQFPIIEIWDDNAKDYIFVADMGALHDEVISIFMSLAIYNALIDFWYSKTGELLYDCIDHDTILNSIQNLDVFYQSENN